MSPASEFGRIDIYLFDQILRGNITPGMRIMDAGCGDGRNMHYLMASGFDVCAVDQDAAQVDSVRRHAAEIAPHLPAANFRVESVDDLSFETSSFDVVICSAVLHFAPDETRFNTMLDELWRVPHPFKSRCRV